MVDISIVYILKDVTALQHGGSSFSENSVINMFFSARTKRKDRGADIGLPPSPVLQPPDATRLHLSYDCVGLVDEAGGNRFTKSRRE